MFSKENQKGRSLLELIAVVVLMSLLSLSGILIYRFATNSYESSVIFDDIMVRGESLRNHSNGTGKSIYDSSTGNKTRMGADMIYCPNANDRSTTPCPAEGAKYFEIKIKGVDSGICTHLIRKNWNLKRVARVKIDHSVYNPKNINCNGVNDDFDLSVIFWANTATNSDRETLSIP